MRTWQVERRTRTRHLIELGGLVIKAGIVDLTGDDRAMIYGALLWMADRLQSDQGRTRAKPLGRKGEAGVRGGIQGRDAHRFTESNTGSSVTNGRWRGDSKYRSAALLFLAVDMDEMASILPWQKRQPKLLQKHVVLRC